MGTPERDNIKSSMIILIGSVTKGHSSLDCSSTMKKVRIHREMFSFQHRIDSKYERKCFPCRSLETFFIP